MTGAVRRRTLAAALRALPHGHTLPEAAWRPRHHALLVVLAAHLVLLPLFGLLEGWSLVTGAALVLPSALFGALALGFRRRGLRSAFAALGLLSCSAVLVVLWHGTIEAHFHYFVMTAALALYEEWTVYGLAVGYVVLQHGLMSQIRGDVVFAHSMAMDGSGSMWSWALIHGGFIAALAVANVASWKASEDARQQADEARTQAEEAFEVVRHQADHDALTGAVNRARFMAEVRAALDARRPDKVLAVLFVDLDDFKSVNDSFGHQAGDELLVVTASRLRDALRPADVLGRFGGDEFVVCLAVTDAEEVERIADRLALVLAAPAVVDGRLHSPSASVGVAIAPGSDLTVAADALVRDADTAMYYAKHRGKARHQLFDATMRVQALDRRSLSGTRLITSPPPVWRDDLPGGPDDASHEELLELARVLDHRPIVSVYQPIIDLESGEAVGYEALARGPEGSPLQRPDRLFAAARRAERLVDLDWMCRQAAILGARQAGLGLDGPALFVNVEPATLDAAVPLQLRHWWDAGVDDLPVVVELTERALTARPAALLRAVSQIRARGWAIALDDVGADVRSIALMPLLRPDVIKLDLRLVQQRPSAEVAAIVNAVNAEHQRTGALILAEGIETEEHLATARTLGATLGQGWLFGHPGPLAEGVDRGPERPLRLTPREPATRRPEVLAGARRHGDRETLLALSRHLEQHAAGLGTHGLLVSAFQSAERFTALTRRRYELLAERSALVVALGVGMGAEPAPGVRGATIDAHDPMAAEWSVIVVGPHFAAALLAVQRPASADDADVWDFELTYDRDHVIQAARTIIDRVDADHRPIDVSALA